MRALVLGATGHIGAHIVRALLADGHQVRATSRSDRFLSLLEGLLIERTRVDLDTLEGLPQALEDCEWVFHAAGYDPGFRDRYQPAIARGIDSTRRVLDAFRRARPQCIVFTSSAATIRRVPDRLATEADAEPWPLDGPRSLYATVKIAMEREVVQAAASGLPVVVVNPSVCLGEYDAHPFSGKLLLAFVKYRLPCYLEKAFNVVYTGDVGVGHVRAAMRGRIGERYLLTHRLLALKDLAELACREAGIPPPRIRLPLAVARAAAEASEAAAWMTRTEPLIPREMVRNTFIGQSLDGSKAVRELGLPQTPVEEAVRRALRWFAAHGYL